MKRKWSPSNFEESILTFTITNRVLGLRAIEYPRGRPWRLLTFFYFATLAGSRFWLVMTKWRAVAGPNPSLEISLYEYAYIAYELCIIIASVASLYSSNVRHAYRITQLHTRQFVKNMMKIDETMKKLGSPIDHRRDMYCCLVMLFIVFAFAVIMSALDLKRSTGYTSLWRAMGSTIVVGTTFCNELILSLDFCVSARSVGIRYEAINNTLLSLAPNIIATRNHKNTSHSIEIPNAWCFFVSQPRRNNDRILQVVHILKQVHLQLGRELVVLCKIYSVQITLAIALAIAHVTVIMYNMYRTTFVWNVSLMQHLPSTLLVMMSCFSFLSSVILINNCCENTIHEADKIKGLVHAVHGLSVDREVRNEVQQFALQTSLMPPQFSLSGLTLNYFLIRSFFGNIFEYLLISIQLGG